MSGAEKVLICNYCSIQLELFFLWRERCKKNDKIFRNGFSDVIAPKQLTTHPKVDTFPSVDFSNNEKVATEKSEIMESINELLTNMKTVFDPSSILKRYETLVPYEKEDNSPSDSNPKKTYTPDVISQSMKCRVS